MKYYLFTFKNTKDAIIAGNLLCDISATMPILRDISADCGIALKVDFENKNQAIKILKETKQINTYNLYLIDGFGNSKTITFIQ